MKKEKNENFCRTISMLRIEKNLKMKDVADGIGINPTTYRKYENGDLEPSFSTLSKLADFFNVSTDFILGRERSQSPKDPIDNSMTVGEVEADLMKRWMALKPETREIVLQALWDIVHAYE